MYQADRVNQTTPGRDSECGYRRTRHRRGSLRRRNRPGERDRKWITMLIFPYDSIGCIIFLFSFSGSPDDADGMDRDDSYPDQPCAMGNHHRGKMGGSHWEDLCSSASICSQSSDEEMKHLGHSKGELYPPGGDTRDYPPAVVNLLPHSGPSATVDLGGPPYPGTDPTHQPRITKGVLKHFQFAAESHFLPNKAHKVTVFTSVDAIFFQMN